MQTLDHTSVRDVVSDLIQFIQDEQHTLSPFGVFLLDKITPDFAQTVNPDRDQLAFMVEVLEHCLLHLHANTFMTSSTPMSRQTHIHVFMTWMDRVLDKEDLNYAIPDYRTIPELKSLDHLFKPYESLDNLIQKPTFGIKHSSTIAEYREGIIRFITVVLLCGLRDVCYHPIMPTYRWFKNNNSHWLYKAIHVEVILGQDKKPRFFRNHQNGINLILKKGHMDHYLYAKLCGFSNYSLTHYPNTQNLVDGQDFFVGVTDTPCTHALNELRRL